MPTTRAVMGALPIPKFINPLTLGTSLMAAGVKRSGSVADHLIDQPLQVLDLSAHLHPEEAERFRRQLVRERINTDLWHSPAVKLPQQMDPQLADKGSDTAAPLQDSLETGHSDPTRRIAGKQADIGQRVSGPKDEAESVQKGVDNAVWQEAQSLLALLKRANILLWDEEEMAETFALLTKSFDQEQILQLALSFVEAIDSPTDGHDLSDALRLVASRIDPDNLLQVALKLESSFLDETGLASLAEGDYEEEDYIERAIDLLAVVTPLLKQVDRPTRALKISEYLEHESDFTQQVASEAITAIIVGCEDNGALGLEVDDALELIARLKKVKDGVFLERLCEKLFMIFGCDWERTSLLNRADLLPGLIRYTIVPEVLTREIKSLKHQDAIAFVERTERGLEHPDPDYRADTVWALRFIIPGLAPSEISNHIDILVKLLSDPIAAVRLTVLKMLHEIVSSSNVILSEKQVRQVRPMTDDPDELIHDAASELLKLTTVHWL